MNISKRLFGNETLGKLVAWLLVLLAFAYPYPTCLSVLLKVSSTPINITARATYLLLSIYIIVICSFKKGLKIQVGGLSLLLFWLCYTLRIIVDLEIFHIETFHTPKDIYSFGLGNIFIPVIAILLGFQFVNLKYFFNKALYLLIGANFFIIYLFIEQHNGLDASAFLERAYIINPSTGGIIVNPISFSLYGGYAVIVGLSGLLLYLKDLSKVQLISSIVAIIIGLPNLVLGASRGPTIITIVAMLLVFGLHLSRATFNARYNIRLFLGLFLFFSMLSSFVLPRINTEDFAIVSRLDSFTQNKKANDREYLYVEAFEMFLDSPAFGNQIVLETTKTYPHNLPLEILMSLGLLGGLLYAIISTAMIKRYILFRRYDNYYPVILVTLFIAMGLSFTSGNIYQNVEFWNLLAALLAARPVNTALTESVASRSHSH